MSPPSMFGLRVSTRSTPGQSDDAYIIVMNDLFGLVRASSQNDDMSFTTPPP